jgi:hypothetical protein
MTNMDVQTQNWHCCLNCSPLSTSNTIPDHIGSAFAKGILAPLLHSTLLNLEGTIWLFHLCAQDSVIVSSIISNTRDIPNVD